MKTLPETDNAMVVRIDFSDDAAWESICAAIREPVGEFQAYLDFVNDPAFTGITIEQLPSLIPDNTYHSFIFIIDHLALSHSEYPILVVDLLREPGRTFRVIPSEMWGVENNLSLANVTFSVP
jgi:hypothetical protein